MLLLCLFLDDCVCGNASMIFVIYADLCFQSTFPDLFPSSLAFCWKFRLYHAFLGYLSLFDDCSLDLLKIDL